MLTKNESLTELAQQRAVGHGAIQVEWRHGRSRIARLFQEGCAKIRMPRVTRNPFEAILINTAGGLTGGDRLNWTVRACEGTSAVITTQACERIYRSPESAAVVETRLTAEKGTHLAWLPQETILFDRSALSRRLDVDMDGSATVLLVEAVVFGRQAMGEIVTEARFHDRWRVRVDGQPIHAEDFRLGPDLGTQLARAAIAGGQRALAPCYGRASQLRAEIRPKPEILGVDRLSIDADPPAVMETCFRHNLSHRLPSKHHRLHQQHRGAAVHVDVQPP